jgi:hypothetical protein
MANGHQTNRDRHCGGGAWLNHGIGEISFRTSPVRTLSRTTLASNLELPGRKSLLTCLGVE